MAKSPVFPSEAGQAARDVEMIHRLFMASKPGDTVTYSDITDIIGRHDKGGDARIHRAVRRARKDGVNMENIRDIGYRHDTAQDTINTSLPKQIRRMRSAANQGIKKLRTVDTAELSNSERVEYNMQAAVLGSARMVLGEKNQDRQRNEISNGVIRISRTKLVG